MVQGGTQGGEFSEEKVNSGMEQNGMERINRGPRDRGSPISSVSGQP